jgi:hypothetical protein
LAGEVQGLRDRYAKIYEKLPYPPDGLTNSWKFMLLSPPFDNSAKKKEIYQG